MRIIASRFTFKLNDYFEENLGKTVLKLMETT